MRRRRRRPPSRTTRSKFFCIYPLLSMLCHLSPPPLICAVHQSKERSFFNGLLHRSRPEIFVIHASSAKWQREA